MSKINRFEDLEETINEGDLLIVVGQADSVQKLVEANK